MWASVSSNVPSLLPTFECSLALNICFLCLLYSSLCIIGNKICRAHNAEKWRMPSSEQNALPFAVAVFMKWNENYSCSVSVVTSNINVYQNVPFGGVQLCPFFSIMRTVIRKTSGHCESSSLQRQYYHEQTLVDSDAQTAFLKHTLICLGVYKWLLYTKISPEYWNAPWGATGSLLTAWSDLVWFANGWKWDCCLQANKQIFDSLCGVIDLRLPEWRAVMASVCLNIVPFLFRALVVSQILFKRITLWIIHYDSVDWTKSNHLNSALCHA